MNRALLAAAALAVLAACAPVRTLDPFAERRPDPVRDQGAHNAPVEWWYFNGHLDTPAGERDFAAAFFQVNVPPDARLGLVNLQALLPNAYYFGHYSVVDAAANRFESSERSGLPVPGAARTDASAAPDRLDVRLGDWRATRDASGRYTLRAALDGDRDAIDLTLTPERPEVVHGPGWSGTAATGRMYYYSATRLRVTGTYAGQPTTGIAWFDHQWGGGDGSGTTSVTPRWDWFSLQLDDGRDVMVYRVRDEQDRPADTFASVTTGGGVATESRLVKLSPWRYWTSANGGTYPLDWTITLEDGTVLTVRPVMDDQEVRSERTAGFTYYEGAVRVTGSVRGVGYMELTGYAPVRGNPLRDPFAFVPR